MSPVHSLNAYRYRASFLEEAHALVARSRRLLAEVRAFAARLATQTEPKA